MRPGRSSTRLAVPVFPDSYGPRYIRERSSTRAFVFPDSPIGPDRATVGGLICPWEHVTMSGAKPSYVVLRQTGMDRWQVIGEVERKPGLSARNARAQAIEDATGGRVRAGQVYRAILSSEWRIAAD